MTAANNRRSRPADAEGSRRDGPRPMHISLRAGEKLFLNGAVIRVDRKATLELLNDATFLLENHVLQVEDTTTPLRQLYFTVQAMLMDPLNAEASRALFQAMASEIRSTVRTEPLRQGVDEAADQVAAGRPFHALKTLRSLFAEEAAILGAPEAERPRPVRAIEGDPTPFARDRSGGSLTAAGTPAAANGNDPVREANASDQADRPATPLQ